MVQVEVMTSHYIIGTCTLLSGHVIVYGLLDTVSVDALCALLCDCVVGSVKCVPC